MDKDREELKMLREAVREMALVMQDSEENPVSLSLYLIDIGVTDASVKDKLIKKAAEMIILTDDDPMDLTVEDFRREFLKISPLLGDEATIIYVLKFIGLHLMPKVYPVAMNL